MATIPPVSTLLDFSGQAVLVTGSGSGLGRGIAQRLPKQAQASSCTTISLVPAPKVS